MAKEQIKKLTKKYIIKDTITNTETGKVLVYFTGVDGYVHDESDFYFCEGYSRRGCALNNIKKSANFINCKPLNDMEYLEGEKWHHVCEILEITPVEW